MQCSAQSTALADPWLHGAPTGPLSQEGWREAEAEVPLRAQLADLVDRFSRGLATARVTGGWAGGWALAGWRVGWLIWAQLPVGGLQEELRRGGWDGSMPGTFVALARAHAVPAAPAAPQRPPSSTAPSCHPLTTCRPRRSPPPRPPPLPRAAWCRAPRRSGQGPSRRCPGCLRAPTWPPPSAAGSQTPRRSLARLRAAAGQPPGPRLSVQRCWRRGGRRPAAGSRRRGRSGSSVRGRSPPTLCAGGRLLSAPQVGLRGNGPQRARQAGAGGAALSTHLPSLLFVKGGV